MEIIMSEVQMQHFMSEAIQFNFQERIQLISMLLQTLNEQPSKDTSFIDEACGCISHEQAEDLRNQLGLKLKEVI